MNKPYLLLVLQYCIVTVCGAQSGKALTLPECYQLAEQHYPLTKRVDLIRRSTDYNIDNLQKGYLPQFSVNAQATYQSAVTTIPINVPGVNVPTLSKDQYKAYVQADQILYDGGEIAAQKALQQSNEAIAQQQLATDLYHLKERINQLFFGALLIDEQLKQNALLAADLQSGLDKTNAAVKNGTAFRSNADMINAELLKVKQQAIELRAARKAWSDMLALFIGQPMEDSLMLTKPQPITVVGVIDRPELSLYAAQNKSLEAQRKLLAVGTRPKLGLFVQGGYGRPGLDMLNNDFAGYYIGGIRLNWSPSAFYTLRKKRAQIAVSREEIGVQQETFLFNMNLTLQQQSSEVSKYQSLLASDDEIIDLQEKVKAAAMAQLENGVITGTDFLKQVNEADQAKQRKLLHEIQLLMAQYNQHTTTGNHL